MVKTVIDNSLCSLADTEEDLAKRRAEDNGLRFAGERKRTKLDSRKTISEMDVAERGDQKLETCSLASTEAGGWH